MTLTPLACVTLPGRPLPLEEWRSSGRDWLLLGEDANLLRERAATPCETPASPAVVILNATPPNPLVSALRAELPPVLAVLADRWSSGDCVLVPTEKLPPLPPRSLHELVVALAAAGLPVSWRGSDAVRQRAGDDVLSHLPALAPATPDATHRWLLECVPRVVRDALPQPASRADATALVAGYLQLHDWLDASHAASQSIEGEGRHRSGDYWHAIMHRREPDYGNSKYWFRRVGHHPIFPDLARAAGPLLATVSDPRAVAVQRRMDSGVWDPLAFVDLCQATAREEASELGVAARQIQLAEMHLLLRQTWRDAAGRL